MASNILIIDDDPVYRLSVGRHLRSMKHVVLDAGTSQDALAMLRWHDLHLVLLEVGLGAHSTLNAAAPPSLPRGSEAYDLLEMIRLSLPDVPIIVLTNLNRTQDELACIRGGADSFLRKPVEFNLLTAYIRSNLRRAEVMRNSHAAQRDSTLPQLTLSKSGNSSLIHAGDLLIDMKQRLVRISDGRSIQLTEKETLVLALLAAEPGKVFGKEEVIDHVWGADTTLSHQAVGSMIKRLRKKIEPVSGKSQYLVSERGLGYRLATTLAHKRYSTDLDE